MANKSTSQLHLVGGEKAKKLNVVEILIFVTYFYFGLFLVVNVISGPLYDRLWACHCRVWYGSVEPDTKFRRQKSFTSIPAGVIQVALTCIGGLHSIFGPERGDVDALPLGGVAARPATLRLFPYPRPVNRPLLRNRRWRRRGLRQSVRLPADQSRHFGQLLGVAAAAVEAV